MVMFFFHQQCSFCHEDKDPVREARFLRLWSMLLEPDSSQRQKLTFIILLRLFTTLIKIYLFPQPQTLQYSVGLH